MLCQEGCCDALHVLPLSDNFCKLKSCVGDARAVLFELMVVAMDQGSMQAVIQGVVAHTVAWKFPGAEWVDVFFDGLVQSCERSSFV